MDVKNLAQDTGEEVVGIGTDLVDLAFGGANYIYHKATGKMLSQSPFSAKVWLNDQTSQHLHFKTFHNIPTTKELQDPNTAKEYVKKAVNHNDNELLQTTFAYSLQNKQSAGVVVKSVLDDFKNRKDVVLKSKGTPQDAIILTREYKLLKGLVDANPQLKAQLPEFAEFDNDINNINKVKSDPKIRAMKETIDHYEIVNKSIDIANGASALLFGAGKGLKIIAKTPIAKVVANAVIGASSITPVAGGFYKAEVNKESVVHTMSPLDLSIGGNVAEIRDIPKTIRTLPSYEMRERLKSKDFDPTKEVLDFYTKNNKIDKREVENFKDDILKAEDVAGKTFKEKVAYNFSLFSKSIKKGMGERANVMLNKVLSIKNSEDEMVKYDRALTEAFYDYEPVKKLITEMFTKEDGRIVIDDVSKLEAELLKLAESDETVAKYIKYDRTKSFLSEIHQAVEHGNSEVVIGKYKSDTIKVDENNRIQPPIENHVIDLKNSSLQDLLDMAEEEFKKGNVISVGYKVGDRLTNKTIKPINHPSVSEFKLFKGKFSVLKDGEWKEIEDVIPIPITRTNEFSNVLKEYAKRSGYEDIKISDATYYKSGHSILTPKIENIAKTVLNAEGKQLSDKEFENLVKEAYDSGFLHKSIETKNGVLDVDVEHYLKSNPSEVINSIKHNITEHMKAVVSRDKEIGDVAEHYVLDQDSNVIKLLNSRLQQLEDFSKHYKTETLNKEIAELKDLTNRFKTREEVGYKGGDLVDMFGDVALHMNDSAELMGKLGKVDFNVFKDYESFKKFASLKHLSPTLSNLKATPALKEFLNVLDDLEKRNPNSLNETQKLLKRFLELSLGRNTTPLVKFQRAFGNLLTLLNPAVSLGNFAATFQNLHLLFPSLDLLKISEVGDAWRKEMKKFIYAEGVYKYNLFNPVSPAVEGLGKAHLLANFKNEETFEKVVEDYCRNLEITDKDFINEMKEFYRDRKEEFADDIMNFIGGLDGRALQTMSVNFAKIGENAITWYKFVTSPFAVATQIIKNWRNAPEHIARHGVGKTIGKALGFSAFSAIALGSQVVPFLAPAETMYTVISGFGNMIANVLGEEDIFTDKNFSQLVLKELDYHYLKSGLLDPNERVNFYTSFGSALLQATAGADAVGWDTNPFVHYLKTGLDIISKLGASGVVSPTAGGYVADIPVPSLSVIETIVKKTFNATDDKTKATETLIALAQNIPMFRNIYKEIAGRTLVKGVGATGKEEIWQPSIPEELLSKEGQGLLGMAHLIGFIALHGETIFDGGMMQKAYQLMRYDLAKDKERKDLFSPVRNPAGVDQYINLNFKDIKVFTDNAPDEIVATLRYIPENKIPVVRERSIDLMTKNSEAINKLLKKKDYTYSEVKELKRRYNALQNYIIVSDYLGWYDDNRLNSLRAYHKQLYNTLQSKQIDIEYKDIIKIKRKLQESK